MEIEVGKKTTSIKSFFVLKKDERQVFIRTIGPSKYIYEFEGKNLKKYTYLDIEAQTITTMNDGQVITMKAELNELAIEFQVSEMIRKYLS